LGDLKISCGNNNGEIYLYRVANDLSYRQNLMEPQLVLIDMILTGEPFVVRDTVQLRSDIVASCTEGNKVNVWHHSPASK